LFQKSLERPSRASFAPLYCRKPKPKNSRIMSFRSNGVDWVRSLRKIQLQDFLFQKWLERPSRASFAPLFRRKPKLRKRNKHESWVKRVDWVRSL
jgi:hypothetical protein